MFSIPNTEFPGLDGFTGGFFKATWNYIGDKVCDVIMKIFNTCQMPWNYNATSLVLLPKVPSPLFTKDFRRIFCYTVLVKCISKLLCSRLKEFLPTVVDTS